MPSSPETRPSTEATSLALLVPTVAMNDDTRLDQDLMSENELIIFPSLSAHRVRKQRGVSKEEGIAELLGHRSVSISSHTLQKGKTQNIRRSRALREATQALSNVAYEVENLKLSSLSPRSLWREPALIIHSFPEIMSPCLSLNPTCY